jgi:alkylation response protein AidB-like acyl-CoA dehydrogenase
VDVRRFGAAVRGRIGRPAQRAVCPGPIERLAGDFEPPARVRPTVEHLHEFVETEVRAVERAYEQYLGDPIECLDDEAKLRPEIREAQAEVRRRSAETRLYALQLPEELGDSMPRRDLFDVIETLFRYGTGHATGRETSGEPIGTNQAVQWPIAETATELEATRAFAERTLAEFESVSDVAALDQPPEARQLLAMLKYYPENRLYEWADRAVQVPGGEGLMRVGGVERVFRVARSLKISAGTTEIQKRTIARTLGLGEGS